MNKHIFIISLLLLLLLLIMKDITKLNFTKLKVVLPAESINKTLEEIILTPNDVVLPSYYLGYIKIEKYNIKNYIMEGTSSDVLNKNVVGKHPASVELDSLFGNIILAGHNNKNVFKNLLKMQINDKIEIITHRTCYLYQVTKIDYISKDDFKYFNYLNDKKIITLITCLNENKRIIIRGELV